MSAAVGPAYVRTVDLEQSPSQAALGQLYVPTCSAHRPPWCGPSTRDQATAALNARVHNTDAHSRDQSGLFTLEETP